jgi:VIT1/CCC1 family predicted Fe2+/Mn2+ transporter
MEEPLISKDRKLEKNVGQMSNFAKYLVKGSLDAIILGISILVSSFNYESNLISHPSGIDLNKLIYFGIPIIVSNAFSHGLINVIVKETDYEAKEARKEIQEDIKENVSLGERGHPVSSAIVYIAIYIIFAMFILLPFVITFYYHNMSKSITMWWFVFIILIELIIVSLVRVNLTRGNFFKSLLEFFLVALIAAGITSLVRNLLEKGIINY